MARLLFLHAGKKKRGTSTHFPFFFLFFGGAVRTRKNFEPKSLPHCLECLRMDNTKKGQGQLFVSHSHRLPGIKTVVYHRAKKVFHSGDDDSPCPTFRMRSNNASIKSFSTHDFRIPSEKGKLSPISNETRVGWLGWVGDAGN